MKPRTIQSLVLLALTVSTISLRGQNVLITKRDSSKVETRIKANSSTSIMTSAGTFTMREVAMIAFEKPNVQDEKFYKQLEAAGVSMRFDYAMQLRDSAYLEIIETRRVANFYVEDSQLYWSKIYKVTGTVDSIKGAIKSLLQSKPEKRSIEDVDDKSAIVIFQDWHLNNKLDGRGGMSYPQIYNSGSWSFASMIIVRDGEYEVKCKNFRYGGVSVGTYWGFGVSSSREVAGDWQTVVVKNDQFRDGQLKSIHLVGKNLEKFFTLSRTKTF